MSETKIIEIICRKKDLFSCMQDNKYVINAQVYSTANDLIREKINSTILNLTEINRRIENSLHSLRNSWKLNKNSGRKLKIFFEKISKEFIIFNVRM
jgi:hypothetical protein